MSLTWYAELERPIGGLAATGITKLLGAPDLDLVEILVRETVQNSWDAAAEPDQPVRFSLRGVQLDTQAIAALRRVVFAQTIRDAETAPALRDGMPILDVLEHHEIEALYISDRGTRGLGGPIHAGVVVRPGERTDFRDFVFRIGAPPDTEHGGGSYGFGKAISYVASLARCIVVYTKTDRRTGPGHESRLIVCALGTEIRERQRMLTGRHWWGEPFDNSIGPVTDANADVLARQLGFREVDRPETGTTIMVLQPRLSEKGLAHDLSDAAVSLCRNFWPKMVPTAADKEPPMTFEVSYQDEPITVPHPDMTPPLHLHSAALRALRGAAVPSRAKFLVIKNPASGEEIPVHIRPVESRSPKKTLGTLAVAIGQIQGAPHRSEEEPDIPFPAPSRWVSLIREPELIVRYELGVSHSAEGLEWGGVFKTTKDLDPIFREAEPPTHDDWNPKSLSEPRHRSFVRVALKRIHELVNELMQSQAPVLGRDPAWHIANELGGLLPTLNRGTLRPPKKGNSHHTGSRGYRIRILASRPIEWKSALCAQIDFVVDAPIGQPIAVEVRGAIAVLEDGRPEDPASIRAIGPTGSLVETDEQADRVSVELPGGEPWTVILEQPDGLSMTAQIRQIPLQDIR